MSLPDSHAQPQADAHWFCARVAVPRPRARLFCLPYAGGHAAMYRAWASRLPPEVELWPVELPGRWSRIDEVPFEHLTGLVEALGPVVARHLQSPYFVLGYSFGALAAFELVRWLRRQGRSLPERLVVLSSSAPQVPWHLSPLHHLSDALLLEQVGDRYARLPLAVLEDPELRSLVLRTLRADLSCFETYRYRPEPPLPIPIHAYGGRTDRATPEASLMAWQAQSSAPSAVTTLPGGHFFVEESSDQFFASLSAALRVGEGDPLASRAV